MWNSFIYDVHIGLPTNRYAHQHPIKSPRVTKVRGLLKAVVVLVLTVNGIVYAHM